MNLLYHISACVDILAYFRHYLIPGVAEDILCDTTFILLSYQLAQPFCGTLRGVLQCNTIRNYGTRCSCQKGLGVKKCRGEPSNTLSPPYFMALPLKTYKNFIRKTYVDMARRWIFFC